MLLPLWKYMMLIQRNRCYWWYYNTTENKRKRKSISRWSIVLLWPYFFPEWFLWLKYWPRYIDLQLIQQGPPPSNPIKKQKLMKCCNRSCYPSVPMFWSLIQWQARGTRSHHKTFKFYKIFLQITSLQTAAVSFILRVQDMWRILKVCSAFLSL